MTPTREALAAKLKEAWFAGEPGVSLGKRWTLVADAAAAEYAPVQVDWSGDPVNTEEVRGPVYGQPHPDAMFSAAEPDDVPVAEWERALRLAPPGRDHRYDFTVQWPDGTEWREQGVATAAELAHRLRFEADLCDPGMPDLPAADEVVNGAPKWISHGAPHGMPDSWTAWNNGVTDSHGYLIEDIDGLEATARAMLAAAAQAKAWRRQL